MGSFSFYYIEANLLCVIVFGIILCHNHFNMDRRDKQIKYDRVLAAFIAYFLADCVWAGVVDGVLPRWLINPVSFVICLCMAATIYCWYAFVMAYLQTPSGTIRRRRRVMLLLFLVSTVALLVHFIAAPETLVNEQLEMLPLYNVYLTAVPDLYMIIILLDSLRGLRKEKSPTKRKKLLFVGFFPLMVSVGGFVQSAFFSYAPIYCFTSLILILVFYIDSIESRISIDPLTRLNNRGQLERYCAQSSNLFVEGRQTVVVMMDVDRFKAINDTYGHAEGDRALMTVSGAVREAVEQSGIPSFACRYGGDEFLLILHPIHAAEADRLIAAIRAALAPVKGAYSLSVSAGYDVLRGQDDSIPACIVRADKKLYQDKARGRQTEPAAQKE